MKLLTAFAITLLLGLCLILPIPENRAIPVQGATAKDWNPLSFWYYPWGKSGVHKGIDIFAKLGTPVLAASPGWVIYTGNIEMGGNVVLTINRRFQLFYYAHLQSINVSRGQWLTAGEALGTVGTTGNAQGKPPHLHFSIIRLWPMLDQYNPSVPQAWKRLFYFDPGDYLKG